MPRWSGQVLCLRPGCACCWHMDAGFPTGLGAGAGWCPWSTTEALSREDVTARQVEMEQVQNGTRCYGALTSKTSFLCIFLKKKNSTVSADQRRPGGGSLGVCSNVLFFFLSFLPVFFHKQERRQVPSTGSRYCDPPSGSDSPTSQACTCQAYSGRSSDTKPNFPPRVNLAEHCTDAVPLKWP